jgi:paraquat-inducible protein A
VTTIVVPLLEMSITLLILVPMRFGRTAPATGLLLRIVQAVRPWGMVEVFILGVLVSLVKLAHQATVIPGIALWSFAGLMLLFAAAAASFDPREVWMRMDQSAPRASS